MLAGCCCCGFLAFRAYKKSGQSYGGYGSSSESDWSEADPHGPPMGAGYAGAGHPAYGVQMPQPGYSPYWQGQSMTDSFKNFCESKACNQSIHAASVVHQALNHLESTELQPFVD